MLANSSAARNFTTLSLVNLTQAQSLRQRESSAAYISAAIALDLPDPITEIDNDLKRALFAHWVRDNTSAQFAQLKATYKQLTAQEAAAAQQLLAQQQMGATTSRATAVRHQHQLMLDPTDVSAINETIGAALSTIPVNGSYINVIVPEVLRRALFVDWEEQPNVLLLLFAYARDMEIPVYMINPNGTRYIIQPPAPPKKGRVANGYEYKSFGKTIDCTGFVSELI